MKILVIEIFTFLNCMLFIGSVWHLFYFREGVGIIESSYN